MADVPLEITNLLRERWLRDVQPLSCATEMELFSDRNEVTKMANLDWFTHIFKISINRNQILDV
jgi:hypothetical protein